ncbi:MAG TPA: helix-turn-helix transcriptional regulator, partial [Longimicrobiales bacterium]|nr:helix-turn-helix transcriptional regulator [Longimicrobiales bacterium]
MILKLQGVPGANYPSISGYLKNETTPPLEFLIKAADALGVRFEWLAKGGDEPRTLREFEARWMPAQSSPDKYHSRVRAAIPELGRLNFRVEPAFIELL